MACTEAAEAGKERVGTRDIAGDLRTQFFGAAEFFLFAKTLPKPHFDPRRRRLQLHIEQMRFDAGRRAVERRAHTDIRNRAAAASLSVEAGARDVDAASGKQLL